MGEFADATEIDQHVGAVFREATADQVIGPRLRAAGVTLRVACHDPECEVVVRMHDPVSVSAHGATAVPVVTLTMRADLLDHFLRGEYSLVEGLARGEVHARGPISRVLRVLPELEGFFATYCRHRGLTTSRAPAPRRAPDSLLTSSTERTSP